MATTSASIALTVRDLPFYASQSGGKSLLVAKALRTPNKTLVSIWTSTIGPFNVNTPIVGSCKVSPPLVGCSDMRKKFMENTAGERDCSALMKTANGTVGTDLLEKTA
jgi:hypothetical protein